MRLQYTFHGQNKEPHPFHIKLDATFSVFYYPTWKIVITQLAEITQYLSQKILCNAIEVTGLKELKKLCFKPTESTQQQSS